MKRKFPKIVKICLFSVYLIFIAGSIVRMTGSGMGCPDWPKCFGYLIPPTNESQILWQANKSYTKGAAIVKNDTLYIAQKRFETLNTFNQKNWKPYTKHTYTKFNVYHTWTEYINRLASAVSGVCFLFLIAVSLKFRKENKWIPILSFGAFLLMLFEAWLGMKVVESVLNPSTITLHMVAGLIIIAILLVLIYITKDDKNIKEKDTTFTRLLWIATIFSLIQIALGTQVRQYVDEQVKILGFENKNLSLLAPELKFYIHRSFTIAIVLINFWLFYRNEQLKLGHTKINWILFLLGVETLTGILMYYGEFPMGTQAIHLLFGVLLFSIQIYLLMECRSKK